MKNFDRTGASLARIARHAVVSVALLVISYYSAAARCMINAEDPATLRFQGILKYRIFPGPPEYLDVKRGDKSQPTYILQLDHPTCATGTTNGDTENFDEVQLNYKDAKAAKKAVLRPLIGKHITVTASSGDAAMFGSHHAPFVVQFETAVFDGETSVK